jgi:hypothetical protein
MTPTIRLHLGPRLALDLPGGETVEIGSVETIVKRLRREPPDAAGLEAAIADIEDMLLPALRKLPQHRELVTAAAEVKQLAEAAGARGRLETAAVEVLFNRLADVANGRPVSSLGFPADRSFAASLLFLRELLHHGGFASIAIE